MTEAVFRQAAAQCAAWARAGEQLSVSVNLNVASLGSRGLLQRLEAIVCDLRIDPASIIFEITEDGLLHQPIAREVLTRLRLQGFGLSIDDFGTGYSTLHQLLEAPFNELKIDQSFVRSAPMDKEAAVALTSSIALAQKLGLTVVGEGIETDAHWRFLEQAGCQIGQGYAIAPPMEAEAFPDWVAGWRRDTALRVNPAPCIAASPV
jgi:EAL domain-containing protein (putative c-di-GMP-specific phosphodiesterase class I)